MGTTQHKTVLAFPRPEYIYKGQYNIESLPWVRGSYALILKTIKLLSKVTIH